LRGERVWDGPGEQLFAGTGFTLNQNGGVRWSYLGDPPQDGGEGGAGANDLFKVVDGANLFFEVGTLPFKLVAKGINLFKCEKVLQGQGELGNDEVKGGKFLFFKGSAAAGDNKAGVTSWSIPERSADNGTDAVALPHFGNKPRLAGKLEEAVSGVHPRGVQ